MMCTILSPNCCAVIIFEYSSTDVTLPSLFVSSERTRCFAKQMAECRFRPPKTSEEEEYCVACERRRISGCHWFGGDKRQPEIRLRSQAKYCVDSAIPR